MSSSILTEEKTVEIVYLTKIKSYPKFLISGKASTFLETNLVSTLKS